jgi:cytochrome P450
MVYAKDEEDATKFMTREEIIDNALLLILAGSETAASTLTVAMLALGLNKDAFQKLKDEQRQLISEHGEELTRSMLDKDCPYLDAVVKETMRIKPLAGTGAVRIAEETIVVDGKQIPKGYGVAFNIFLTHASDPVVKEEDGSHMDVAKGFKPERWLSDETKPTEYMPFGYGARFCLGYNLAMAEMKVFLALFARRVDYDLVNMTPDHVTWKKMSIIPKPEDGAVISVTSISK